MACSASTWLLLFRAGAQECRLDLSDAGLPRLEQFVNEADTAEQKINDALSTKPLKTIDELKVILAQVRVSAQAPPSVCCLLSFVDYVRRMRLRWRFPRLASWLPSSSAHSRGWKKLTGEGCADR